MRELTRKRRGAARAVVIGLVVACALVFALVGWLERERPDANATPVGLAHAPTEIAGPAVADADLTADVTTERAPAAAEATVADAADTTLAPADTIAREPVDVLVVDRDTKTPVAGAEVLWANLSEIGYPPGDPRRPRWMPDPEEVLASARRATTDERGLATIDSRVFQGRIGARRGDAFGWTHAHEVMPRPLRIEIAPDRALVFEVVDADGRPVGGAPVGLRKSKQATLQPCFWTGTTEAETGRATYTSLNELSGTVYACLQILASDVPAVAVDLADPPKEIVRFVMPPCGSVTVDVHDAAGSPVTPDAISIGIDETDVDGKARFGEVRFVPETFEDGRATFPFVGIGLRIAASALHQGRSVSVRGLGPARLGHEVYFDLSTGPPLVTLAGRLVDEAGMPIASRWIQFSTVAPGCAASRPLRTDAQGRFLQSTSTPAGQLFRGTIACVPIGIGTGEGARADVEVEVLDAPALVELGDVVVRTPARIASGIVVDDRGEAVSDALISAETADASGTWRQDPRIRTTIARDGRFAVHAVEIPVRLRIRATRPTSAPVGETEFEPGVHDARIVLPRASEIAGRVLLDADVEPSLVEVRVALVGTVDRAGPDFERRRTKLDADGSFILRGLQPGRADITFRSKGAKAAAHTVEGVDLPPGGRATDGRLDAIDLRGKLPPAGATGSAPKR